MHFRRWIVKSSSVFVPLLVSYAFIQLGSTTADSWDLCYNFVCPKFLVNDVTSSACLFGCRTAAVGTLQSEEVRRHCANSAVAFLFIVHVVFLAFLLRAATATCVRPAYIFPTSMVVLVWVGLSSLLRGDCGTTPCSAIHRKSHHQRAAVLEISMS